MDIKKIAAKLSPLERQVVPVLKNLSSPDTIAKKTKLSEIEVMRALQWLSNKKIITLVTNLEETIELGDNGKEYAKKGLPEKRFLKAIKDKKLAMQQVMEKAGINKQELNACIGILRKKAAIVMDKEGISLSDAGKNQLEKESLEDKFLKKLAEKNLDATKLGDEERFAFNNLQQRQGILNVVMRKSRTVTLTKLGEEICNADLSTSAIEKLTPEMLKDKSWKSTSFRGYDVSINVPKISGGRRHFVNQATDYARQVWIEMGFKEMNGPIINTSFWNFDALFTAQDHPVREMQDTFYVRCPEKGKLPDAKLLKGVRDMHEHGGNIASSGWNYKWNPENAKMNVLRTHTTVLSAQTLAKIKETELPAKFFAVGKCFRNETLDWSHLFEFNQTEGIVIDPDANFRHLLGYLKRFFTKLGYEEARFRPAYFPYTEMSVEIDVFHPVHKKWFELGGAGMFRPEVVVPLLGKDIPVLAWGPGFDRIMLEYYNIQDIRELYKNDLKQLREIKAWLR